ncbi:uncharacterized protein ACNS7B_016631 [Menidia menidia]
MALNMLNSIVEYHVATTGLAAPSAHCYRTRLQVEREKIAGHHQERDATRKVPGRTAGSAELVGEAESGLRSQKQESSLMGVLTRLLAASGHQLRPIICRSTSDLAQIDLIGMATRSFSSLP